MVRMGLKLGVGEETLVDAARRLWSCGEFDFLELFVPLDATPGQAALWDWYDGEAILHAPHSASGFNFAAEDLLESNCNAMKIVNALRDRLTAEWVVFHAGTAGTLEDALRQMDWMRTALPELHASALIENKPRLALNGKPICLGSSPGEIQRIINATGWGFCCDIRHATAYAAFSGRDWEDVLDEFAGMRPRLWHVADGRLSDSRDSHFHIGEGDIPWGRIRRLFDAESMLTVECGKEPILGLTDFLGDAMKLRDLLHCG